MQVIADRVGVEGPHGTLLPSTSLTVSSGELTVVHGAPGTGITAFGLALAGRLRPTTGTVSLSHDDRDNRHDDGDSASDDASVGPSTTDPAALRRLAAIVDSPGVSEPDDALPLRVVVGEELALARKPANREAVTRWLADHDGAAYADTRFENLDADLRTRLLTTLAASRDGVRLLVLDRPDRHTSDVDSWSMLAHEHAERGLAVVVLTATVSESAVLTPVAHIGSLDQPQPTRCQPEVHP